jgi:hypothetical protein
MCIIKHSVAHITKDEYMRAAILGIQRCADGYSDGKRDTFRCENPHEMHIRGAIGELGFAKMSEMINEETNGTYKTQADFGNDIEVKTVNESADSVCIKCTNFKPHRMNDKIYVVRTFYQCSDHERRVVFVGMMPANILLYLFQKLSYDKVCAFIPTYYFRREELWEKDESGKYIIPESYKKIKNY